MTLWFASFCKGCLMAMHKGLGLYAQSGVRI